ncbi:hypothetical protein PTKIN_Ptkin09bG0038500 [Pterospermum kingtungense]
MAICSEMMEKFFACCESVLAEDGLLVLQFISIPEERYDEFRRSSHFMKEYIFPAKSWLNLGFNDKFIRTWEYYFDYCAAGFKSNTLGPLQTTRRVSGSGTCVFSTSYKLIENHIIRKCKKLETEDEDLKVAQPRKISSLIDKARIEKWHKVLDIGCGWGTFGIEVVKRTGCKYTGISLSEEQVKFAQSKVKEAGLKDNIEILLCDYRQLPKTCKYDRIISVEMIEHVGDEYMGEFFRCCESLLAEDGLFILQFISIPEELFEETARSPGFIKEYIFPGGCLLPLSRVLSAMAAASRLSVEHVENIGPNYFQTLRCWRKNFLENKSKILTMGFDEMFMRTWEYYFDYCAAGFKSRTLGDYQVVFARPGNFGALGEPYQGFPSAYSY